MKIDEIKSIAQDVVFLDIKTSGINPYTSEILEINAIKIENNKSTFFHTLVKNKKEVPLEIFSLYTNLNKEELNKAPILIDIKEKLVQFIKDKTIICHNTKSQKEFLNYYIPQIKNKIIDSLELAIILEPYHKEYTLQYLKNNLINDLNNQKNKSSEDTKDIIKVVNALLMRLKYSESQSYSLENLTFTINSILNKFLIEKWDWSEIIDNGDYNFEDKNVIFENEENMSSNKKDMKNILINNRFSYEELLKKSNIWESKKGFNYEFRPGQFEFSKIIRETMNTRAENIACIEAPTGIGKSVGYLLPSIMESYLNHKRIIISTDTKELQTQLIKKDIPNLINSLGLEKKVSFGYIKGKSNYICVEKLEKYINEYDNDKYIYDEIMSLIILQRLVQDGQYGDIEEINHFIFNKFPYILTHLRQIYCDPNTCRPKKML